MEEECPLCAKVGKDNLCVIHSIFNSSPGWALYDHEKMLHTQTKGVLENAFKRVAQLEYIIANSKGKTK